MDALIAEGGNFVFDSLGNRKPMQRLKKWSYVIRFFLFENEMCSTVLNTLKDLG